MSIDLDLPIRGTAYVLGDDLPVEVVAETVVQRGGIVVAGRNFPTGVAHDAAVAALVDTGVAAVIAETMSVGFFGAATNAGLPAFAVPGVASLVRDGDELELALRTATVRNLRTGEELHGTPIPARIAALLEAGGTHAYVARKYGEPRRAAAPKS